MRRWYHIRICIRLVVVSCVSSTIALSLSAAAPLLAEDSFPYTAIVVAGEAEVRSGPGDDFYATAHLAKGTTVEVYRHDADGWHAIRPPLNSFSWIAAEHLELTDNPTLGRIINVPVKTRIGSEFSDVHDVEYVSLHKSEIVNLLGSKTLREASGEPPRRWFKVAPPAGEFRWVHAKTIRQSEYAGDPETVVGTEAIKTFDLVEDRPSNQSVAAGDQIIQPDAFVDISAQIRGVNYEEDAAQTPVQAEPVVETNVPINNDVAQHVIDDAGQPSLEATHVNAVTWEAVGRPTDILSAPEPRSFRDRYNALNVMLSRAVLQHIELWQLDNVKEQAGLLLGYANTADERELVESLLAKADEFQQLQQRSTEIEAGGSRKTAATLLKENDENVSKLPIPLPTLDTNAVVDKGPEMPKLMRPNKKPFQRLTRTTLLPGDEVDNSVFDASGVLVAVRSRRPDMPRYALTDSRGQITRFVSLETTANRIDRYVNQKVGIIGQVGLLRRFNKPHISASRVVALREQ